MKVLKIYGEDYAASSFEHKYRGVSVIDIINNPDNYVADGGDDYADGYWELEVKEFEGEIDMKFVSFVRNEMIDYDSSKHETFYLETETI